MSMITSCPACGTMFRVVPDQLKISEGWVRCGHCSEVFDASAHLSDESELGTLAEAQGTMSAPLTPPSPPSVLTPSRDWERDAVTTPVELKTRPAELPERPTDAAEEESSRRSSDPSDFFLGEEGDPALEPSPLDAPFVFRRSEITLSELGPEPEPGRESQLLPEGLDEFGEEAVPNVSFVRQARRRAWWKRPAVRVLMALLVLVLGAALALQVAYQDRDRLALGQPVLRPALERMCEALHCTLGAPRQIESIAIDSSGFNRVRNETYRLTFTLRNAAPVPVAAPSMELTITDAQDQPVVRRVLTPAELGAADGVISAGGDWSRSIGLTVDAGSAPRVAGYRLLAFYP